MTEGAGSCAAPNVTPSATGPLEGAGAPLASVRMARRTAASPSNAVATTDRAGGAFEGLPPGGALRPRSRTSADGAWRVAQDG